MPGHRNIADLVYAYQPRAISPAEWQVVRPYVVAVAETNIAPIVSSRADLRNHMLAVTMTATTAASLGRELTHENVFDPEVIEYAINRSMVSSRVKGVRRSILVRLGRELNPTWPFADTRVHYGYEAPDAPYSDDEMLLLRQWAAGQSTEYQRRSATVLLALGVGAGLRIGEMASLRASDIAQTRDGIVTVTAAGYRGSGPREVPVRAEWEGDLLRGVSGLASNDFALFSQRASATAESVAAILTRIGKPSRVHLDTRRLRTTWIVTLMHEYVPEAVIAPAAGLASLQHFKKWLVPREVDRVQAQKLLRGGDRFEGAGLRLI